LKLDKSTPKTKGHGFTLAFEIAKQLTKFILFHELHTMPLLNTEKPTGEY
jgi:hypothetical protein